MVTEELLEQLERQHRGLLSPAEATALDTALQESALASDAAAYRQLWRGFDAWMAEDFRGRMEGWSTGWATHEDAELIEWYLQGQLSPTNQERLERRLAEEPVLAAHLQDQRRLQGGFAAMQTEAFSEKVRSWSAGEPAEAKVRPLVSRRRPWRRWTAAAAVLLVLMALGGNWYSNYRFSDTALFDRYYQAPATGTTLGSSQDVRTAFVQDFAAAHENLQEDNVTLATEQFSRLLGQLPALDLDELDARYYRDNLEWSLILARLRQGEQSKDLKASVDVIAADSRHTYQAEAQALSHDLSSLWRGF
ncbi:MAG: hypothetical protein KDC54_15975 [Lewinella sp.]|nr:hypothetical protein [Lewinella sp.]